MEAYSGSYTYTELPRDLASYPVDEAVVDQRSRRYRVFAIVASLAVLWLAPVLGGDSLMIWAILGCLALCLWDPVACLFLMIASVGSYFTKSEAYVFRISPTQIVGLALFLRCLISPGISGIAKAVGSINRTSMAFLGLFFASVCMTGILRFLVQDVYTVLTGIITFITVATLAYQCRDARWITTAVLVGLSLPILYYLLIWTGFLAPAAAIHIDPGVHELRLSSGRNDPNYIGTLVASCFSLVLFLFLATSSPVMRLIYMAMGGLAFITVVDTGSRAALVASGFGVLMAFLLAVKFKGARAVGLMFVLFILGVVFAVVFWGIIGGRLTTTIERFTTAEGFAGGRVGLWGRASIYILTHPIPDPRGWFHVSHSVPHQTFLSAGVAGGLFALVGLVGLAITSLLQARKNIRSASLTQRPWFSAFFLILFVICVAVCSITTIGHKLLWSMFAICSLRTLGEAYSPDPAMQQ